MESLDRVLVLFVDQEAVIPILVEPAFALRFQVREVHDASDGILILTGNEEVCDVVVAVEMFAFSAVLVEAVACAEFDPAHDGKAHIRFLDRGRCIDGGALVWFIIRHWKALGWICVDRRRDWFSFPGYSRSLAINRRWFG